MRRTVRAPARRQSLGLSLIELMVALVLGLIVTGSALTLVLTNRQTFNATENLSRMQENVRIAFELLARDLRQAGGTPCDAGVTVVNGLDFNPVNDWWLNWGNGFRGGVLGYDGDQAFPDAAFGNAEGDRVGPDPAPPAWGVGYYEDGSDALELKTAIPLNNALFVSPSKCTADGQDLIDVGAPIAVPKGVSAILNAGDILLICNFTGASIFEATGFNTSDPNVDKIEHVSGARNLSNNLALDFDACKGTTEIISPEEDSMISEVRAARWYVGANGQDTNGDGVADGRSLFRATGSMANPQEVVRGVADMELSYLIDGAYTNAGSVADWNDVTAVRIALMLVGDDSVDGQRVRRWVQYTVALRGRAG